MLIDILEAARVASSHSVAMQVPSEGPRARRAMTDNGTFCHGDGAHGRGDRAAGGWQCCLRSAEGQAVCERAGLEPDALVVLPFLN